MNIDFKTSKLTLKYENTPILTLEISYPEITSETKKFRRINNFYLTSAKKFENSIKKVFFEKVKKEFTETDDKRKYYRFAPYKVSSVTTGKTEEKKLLCINRVRVERKNTLLSERVFSQSWSLEKILIMSHKSE